MVLELYKIIIFLIVAFVAIMGSVITNNSIKNGWYSQGVHVSNSQPPNYIFAIVWIVLYIIYILVWDYVANKVNIWINILFLVNMLLNLLWSYVFFGKGDIPYSQLIILMLLIVTITQIFIIYNLRKKLPYYRWCILGLVLYAAWLSAATGLNFAVSK